MTAPELRSEEHQPAFTEAQAQAIATSMDENTPLVQNYELCPADVFGRNVPFWRAWMDRTKLSYTFCEQEPDQCMSNCLTWSNPDYCFGLAQAFAFNKQHLFTHRYSGMMYSMACALGKAAGCVNRAAGIRNVGQADNPFGGKDLQTKELCEFRSFTIGCEQGDAWGCAMLGQSYGNGEGTAKDPARARHFYDRSCEINPDFVACDFAKDGAKDLDLEPSAKP